MSTYSLYGGAHLQCLVNWRQISELIAWSTILPHHATYRAGMRQCYCPSCCYDRCTDVASRWQDSDSRRGASRSGRVPIEDESLFTSCVTCVSFEPQTDCQVTELGVPKVRNSDVSGSVEPFSESYDSTWNCGHTATDLDVDSLQFSDIVEVHTENAGIYKCYNWTQLCLTRNLLAPLMIWTKLD